MGSMVKAGYWPAYRYLQLPPSSVDSSLYTHLFYAFADLDAHTSNLILIEDWQDKQRSISEFTSAVQRRNPSVKTLISIGGASSPKEQFAKMSGSASSRSAFIQSSITLARQYSFHGLDLDWEHPHSSTDMLNFGLLLHEWKAAIENEARQSGKAPLLLTAAVYYSSKFLWEDERKYPIQSIKENLDWVNLMTYDFHGSWEPNKTGVHAALFDPQSPELNASYGVQSWLDAGLPREKVVMGMPIYGRYWKLAKQSEVKIGAPAKNTTIPGSEDNAVTYTDIVNDFIERRGATEVFDRTTVSAYCFNGLDWIGYDNEESVKIKVEFARNKRLRGYFFWEIGQDCNWALSKKASQAWS